MYFNLETFIIAYCLGTIFIIFITGFSITILLKPLNYISYDIIVKSFKQDDNFKAKNLQ